MYGPAFVAIQIVKAKVYKEEISQAEARKTLHACSKEQLIDSILLTKYDKVLENTNSW